MLGLIHALMVIDVLGLICVLKGIIGVLGVNVCIMGLVCVLGG